MLVVVIVPCNYFVTGEQLGLKIKSSAFSGQVGSIGSSLGDEFKFGLVLIESDLRSRQFENVVQIYTDQSLR